MVRSNDASLLLWTGKRFPKRGNRRGNCAQTTPPRPQQQNAKGIINHKEGGGGGAYKHSEEDQIKTTQITRQQKTHNIIGKQRTKITA